MENDYNEEDLETLFKKLVDTEEIESILIDGEDNKITPDAKIDNPLVLCGSFNPLHEGHMKLLDAAYKKFPTRTPCFQLCVINCDKGPINFETFAKRSSQFIKQGKKLLVSKSPLFIHMAKIWPSCMFLLGYDTFTRLLLLKYYDNSEEKLQEALQGFRDYNSQFLVAGRYDSDQDKFLTPDFEQEVEQEDYRDMFFELTEEEFRVDLSSTELRGQGKTL
mmetsp:Transcript_4934/g.4715  ORF Transcript_4934/g.4715 Transcript_4934/m.4715 type:complete len:220 (-) Transcript_4934:31-690(-)